MNELDMRYECTPGVLKQLSACGCIAYELLPRLLIRGYVEAEIDVRGNREDLNCNAPLVAMRVPFAFSSSPACQHVESPL